MSKRILVALTTLAALVLPASALGGTPSVTVKLPKSITALKLFPATITGDTGPGTQSGGNFIVNVTLVKTKTCPASPNDIGIKTDQAAIGSGNVFSIGAFALGAQSFVYKPGKYAVCSWLTADSASIAYTLISQGSVTVKKAKKNARFPKSPKVKDGVYTAATAATAFGTPTSSVTFTITGGIVVSTAVTGLPTGGCRTSSFITPINVADSETTNTPSSGVANKVFSDTFTAQFDGTPNANIAILAGAVDSKTLIGTASGSSSNYSCSGGFTFTAKRP